MENIDFTPQEYFDLKKENERLKEEVYKKREEIANLLCNLKDENGNPYLNEEWIRKNILKINEHNNIQ